MGEQFGEYEIIRPLGSGGMATTHLAVRRGAAGFRKVVALKRILTQSESSPESIVLFKGEAKLAADLIHPNIAQVFDFGEIGGVYYMALEFIEGADLRVLTLALREQNQPMPLDMVKVVAVDLCAALAYAHQLEINGAPANIVHRDVSPANVLISYAGAVKLADFGIAKAITNEHKTETGVVKGKVAYMAPEQALMGKSVDGRADLFSLSVVLYEIAAGRRPFTGTSELDTLQNLVTGKYPPLIEVAPHIPYELAAVIERNLKPQVADRFADAEAMLDALAAFTLPANARLQLGKLVRTLRPPVAMPAPTAMGSDATVEAKPRTEVLPGGARRDGSPATFVTATPADATRTSRARAALGEQPTMLLGGEAGDTDESKPPVDQMSTRELKRARVAAEESVPSPTPSPTPAPATPAATRTKAPGRLAIAGGAGLLLLAIVSAAVVLATRNGGAVDGEGGSDADAGVPLRAVVHGDAGAAAAMLADAAQRTNIAALLLDAGPIAPASIDGGIRDAALVQATPPDAGAPERIEADVGATRSATARLTVRVYPHGEVMIDGRPAGVAPATREVAAGMHTVVATNGEHTITRRLALVAGERKTILIELEQ